MSEVADFVNARLGEWEAAARSLRVTESLVTAQGIQIAERAGRLSPAHVLRVTKALRAIVTAHQAEAWCEYGGCSEIAVRHLATIWPGHPDYRAEWAP